MHKYTKTGLISFSIQIESTEFYGHQKSLEQICEYLMLLAVGISLIGLWETRSHVKEPKTITTPTELKENEISEFKHWITEDLGRKYLSKNDQVRKFRRHMQLKAQS